MALDRAERSVAVPGGVGLLHSEFPMAHDHNRLLLWLRVDAATVAASADNVLGGEGLDHRLIDVQDLTLADRLTAGLQAAGYGRSDELVMGYDGGEPLPAASVEVTELNLAQRVSAAAAGWRAEQPDWPAEVSWQLGARIQTITSVVDASFLAVIGTAGIVARADLYVRDGTAQIEEVFTDPAVRGQGFASALVQECAGRARDAGADVIFLVADVDGPTGLYRRLGFTDRYRTASFTR